MDAVRIQSKFILASSQQLHHPGQIVLRDGLIDSVSSDCSQEPDIDLGETVLLPGLVNAHTHLEFSDLAEPFARGASFPDWIGSVVAHRRSMEAGLNAPELRQRRQSAIRSGLREAFQSGTAILADIVSYPWQADDLPIGMLECQPDELPRVGNWDLPTSLDPKTKLGLMQHIENRLYPRVIALPEAIGLTQDRIELTLDWALQTLQLKPSAASNGLLAGIGISPHAPYSLDMNVVHQAIGNLPPGTLVAMHVAESLEEREWLESGTGPFRESFERLGLPCDGKRPSISDAIRLLADRERALLIHGNYLTPDEIAQIRGAQIRGAQGISIVYCPRTHRHFAHSEYPLSAFLKAGLRVVIGTDSRASSPDLNLWSELVEARESHSSLSPVAAFDAITSAAASAVGHYSLLGSLAPGKFAFVNCVPCDPRWSSDNLLECLTSSVPQIVPLHLLALASPV